MDRVQLPKRMNNAGRDRTTAGDTHNEQVTMNKLDRSEERAFYPCWLLLMFFKVIGLATFTTTSVVPRNNSPTPSSHFLPSNLGIIYNVLLTFGAIGVNYFSLPYRYYMDNSRLLSLSQVIEIAQGILGTLVLSTMFLAHCFGQTTFVRIANRLLDIEFAARQFQPTKGWKRIFVGTVICFLFACLSVSTVLLDYIAYDISPLGWFTDVVPTFCVGWFMLQYFFVLRLIEDRFADVHRSIQRLPMSSFPECYGRTSMRQTQLICVNVSLMNDVLRLENIHARLHEVLADVTGFYSLPMLGAIAFIFLSLIYNGFFVLAILLLYERCQTSWLISTIWWLAFLNFPLLMLSNKVNVISAEIDRTGSIIHSLLSRTNDERVKAKLQQFSLELLHRNVRFTACGFFALDNSMFHSIIAAATTYLVILVQFQAATMNKSS